MKLSAARPVAVELVPWCERLKWSGLVLLVGGIVPFSLLWWVASHRLRQPAGAWAVVQAAYTNPFEPFSEVHLFALPPFVLLAIVCLTSTKWLTHPARLPGFVGANLLLACLPMYFLVWPLRHTYLRHESAIFAPMWVVISSTTSAALLLHSFLILHRCFLRRSWPD